VAVVVVVAMVIADGISAKRSLFTSMMVHVFIC